MAFQLHLFRDFCRAIAPVEARGGLQIAEWPNGDELTFSFFRTNNPGASGNQKTNNAIIAALIDQINLRIPPKRSTSNNWIRAALYFLNIFIQIPRWLKF
jgi:hypothetical protein